MMQEDNTIQTYNEIARIYDLFNNHDVKEDIKILETIFYDYRINFTQACIIEAGAGTGRITIPLSQRVQRVIHVEPAKKMLELAVEKARKLVLENIHFQNLKWEELGNGVVESRCHAVIGMDKVFHYLHERSAQEQAVKRSWACLQSKGLLILDLFYFPGLILREKPPVNTEMVQGEETIIRQSTHRVDPEREVFILEDMYLIISGSHGTADAMIKNQHEFSIFTKREIISLLEQQGFKNIHVYQKKVGETELDALRFLVVGQKP